MIFQEIANVYESDKDFNDISTQQKTSAQFALLTCRGRSLIYAAGHAPVDQPWYFLLPK